MQKYHCHPKYRRREEGHDILLLEVPRAAAVELGSGRGTALVTLHPKAKHPFLCFLPPS